jgi:uncharacterized protein YbjQ (UPF0145 family)
VTTSGLSIDETILLHSIGWQPVDLVCGAGCYSIPEGFWSLGQGESTPATLAWERSFRHAVEDAHGDCRRAGGHGVVGVHLDVSVTKHYVKAVLVGTAASPINHSKRAGKPFICDLSVKDFVLLHSRGWQVRDLVYGCSFVFVPRRNPLAAARQAAANVELGNYTESLYRARSAAVDRMQAGARAVSASGIVAVHLTDGPLPFAGHAVHFTAFGTAISPDGPAQILKRPRMTLTANDLNRAKPKVASHDSLSRERLSASQSESR